MVKITSLGHACYTVEDGVHRVIIDPFLDGNPVATKAPAEVEVDAVIATHGHSDHLGDSIPIARRLNVPIIAPYELAMYCQRHGATVHPLHIGGGFNFPFGRVKLTPAAHGSAVVTGEHIEYTGAPCGVLVTMGGRTVYHTGDTGLIADLEVIGRTNAIDVAIVPIGDNFTMGPDDAVEAVKMIRPRWVIPMHYEAFDLIRQDPQAFARRVGALAECVVLEPGASLEI